MSAKYMRAEERRAAIVDAVLVLAATHSPSAITTAAIAREMSLTQGALFRHFATKGEVWEGVMQRIADDLLAKISEVADASPTPLAALEAMFMAHVDFVCTHPGVPRLVFSVLQQPEDSPAAGVARRMLQSYGKRLTKLINAGKAGGQLDPGVNATAARLLFVGAIQGLVVQSLLAGEVREMRARAPGVFATYRRGIENRT